MGIVDRIRIGLGAAGSLFYPPHCAHCRAVIDAGAHLCETCEETVARLQAPFCQICSEPFEGEIDSLFTCPNCRGRRFHFESAVAACRSRGVVRELIHRFKYRNEFYLRHPLAEWLLAACEDPRIRGEAIDYFVPVPLHPVKRREREFNQADVLARMAGKRLGVPVLNCLKRVRNTTTQTRFDRRDRMENLRNAFQMRKNRGVQGKHLVVVDDVLTTGSTVDECARVLQGAGAASVRVVIVARG